MRRQSVNSQAEYADKLQSAFLSDNPERLVRRSFRTAQGLRGIVLDKFIEDAELVVLAHILDDPDDAGSVV